jgi:hypothetical protein
MFGHFYPADSDAGGLGYCGFDGILKQDAIILSCFYQIYPLCSYFFLESMINTKL